MDFTHCWRRGKKSREKREKVHKSVSHGEWQWRENNCVQKTFLSTLGFTTEKTIQIVLSTFEGLHFDALKANFLYSEDENKNLIICSNLSKKKMYWARKQKFDDDTFATTSFWKKKIKLAGWEKNPKPYYYVLQLDQASDQKLLQSFLKYSKLYLLFSILPL